MPIDANNLETTDLYEVKEQPIENPVDSMPTPKEDETNNQSEETTIKQSKKDKKVIKLKAAQENKKTKPKNKATKEKKKKNNDSAVTKDRSPKKVTDLLPFIDVTEEGYFETKYGEMEILQLQSENVKALREDDVERLINRMTTFLRVFADDVKWVGMTFPTNVNDQREYWQKIYNNTTDPRKLKYLQITLEECNLIESRRTSQEYYLFVFGKDKKTEPLKDKIKDIISLSNQSFPASIIPENKKYQVLFKLNNQNTKIQNT
jgi:hypothetical protein